MKHLRLAVLTIILIPTVTSAQSPQACRSRAQLQRDVCLREAQGDNRVTRRCMSQYISNLQRCRSRPELGPRKPLPRVNPLRPRSKPVQPKLNIPRVQDR